MAEAYQTIKDFIKAKLDALTKIQEVSGYPEMDFAGYPAAVLVPNEGESDFETNVEDWRAYVFLVHVYVKYGEVTKETALDRAYDASDDVLAAFAEDKPFSGIALPANITMITVDPVHSGWEEVSQDSLIRATVELRVRVSVDNT